MNIVCEGQVHEVSEPYSWRDGGSKEVEMVLNTSEHPTSAFFVSVRFSVPSIPKCLELKYGDKVKLECYIGSSRMSVSRNHGGQTTFNNIKCKRIIEVIHK